MQTVYFIQSGSDGPIKIGTAVDPRERLRKLQMGSPVRLRLLAIAQGVGLEKRLHRQFRDLRGLGEWFEPGKALLDWIGENALSSTRQPRMEERLYRCFACGHNYTAGRKRQTSCSPRCERFLKTHAAYVGRRFGSYGFQHCGICGEAGHRRTKCPTKNPVASVVASDGVTMRTP